MTKEDREIWRSDLGMDTHRFPDLADRDKLMPLLAGNAQP